ncbi:HAMP domain-containing protein [Verrucomicrobia bacterium]|nr:HAMP domain-containing protein [Verrucomicrobiota bacterium]
MEDFEVQHVGYLAPIIENSKVQLVEVVFTKVVDSFSGDTLGAIVLGFPVLTDDEENLARHSKIQSGMLVGEEFYSKTVPESEGKKLIGVLKERVVGSKEMSGMIEMKSDVDPYSVMFRRLNSGSIFPPAYHVSLFSLSKQLLAEIDMRRRITIYGCVMLVGALVLVILLSHGFSEPIRELAIATDAIRSGHFETRVEVRSRDEIGQLTESFNVMAADLEKMEKYHNVLNMVADKEVAEQMMSGSVTLGGEMKEISVLFCDIRGFTALTQNMPPTEVIDLMNEHMTALTRVVYEHDGVVDKFVGDLIMAVFGAPKTGENDAYNAARCALRMIEERNILNETADEKITVGIGVASGPAVAGCMGSVDRLNYTVLGERVNLAARLCSAAGIQEVVIDKTTLSLLGDLGGVDALPPLKVKGFSNEVSAFKLYEVRSLVQPVTENQKNT